MISIKLLGATELTHALDQWQGEVRAPRQMFVNLVSDVIAPDIADRFAAQGPGWRPLSPAYASWKAEHFPGRPLLVLSGAMKAALTDRSRFGGGQSAFGANTLNLAPKGIDYFADHQLGGRRVPQRKMIDLAALEPKIHAYIEKWLTGRARDFGLVRR